MRLSILPLLAAIVLAPILHGQSSSIVITTDSGTRSLTASDLNALPQDTLRMRAHEGPEQAFVGPSLETVLALAAVQLDSLRGPALARYLLVEARDNYRVVFSLAELSPELGGTHVILAHSVDGHPLTPEQGPWRLIVQGESRPARWVRQVSTLRVLSASK